VLGLPGDTMQFRVGVRNDGDGLDFYGVNLTMSIADDGTQFGWKNHAAGFGGLRQSRQMVYVYFSVRVALFSPDTVNNIGWSVYSKVDTTKKVTGNFNIFMTLTDVNDGGGSLPNSFAVQQNYPNPFNPPLRSRSVCPKPRRHRWKFTICLAKGAF